MRVKIDFIINDNFTFSKYLNEAMTAYIYRCISLADKSYAKMLHDNGFSQSGYKKFTYHTYALLQNRKTVENKLTKGKASLIFSSELEDTVIKFVEGLVKIGKIQLLSHSFNIDNIQYIKENKVKTGLFRIASPVYMMDINHVWLKPGNIEEYLKNNLIQKYHALYNTLPNNIEMNIKFLNYSAAYIKYKQSTFKGYVGTIALQGDSKLIKIAYNSGLGSHNGIGLGLIEAL